MKQFWIAALSVGGIASVGAFVLYSLYKEWLKVPWLKDLTKKQKFSLMKLFLILTFSSFLVAAIIFIIGPQTTGYKDSNVNVDVNKGTVNINYNTLSENDKVHTLSRLSVQGIYKIGVEKLFKKEYSDAVVLFESALNIEPNNVSSINKLVAAKSNIIKDSSDRELIFQYFLGRGNALKRTKPTFPEIKNMKASLIYFQAAKSLYPFGSPKNAKTDATLAAIRAFIMREAGNELDRDISKYNFREKAENAYNLGKFMEALYQYSLSYRLFKSSYSLEHINFCLEKIRNLS